MNFIVLGHPRSGTGFMAALLNGRGFDVGHESWKANGISDWHLGCDHMGKYEMPQFTTIIHAIRDPYKCIESAFLTISQSSKAFIWDSCNIPQGPELNMVCMGWIAWYKSIRHKWRIDMTIRVEKMCDFMILDEITQSNYFPPTDTNTRPHRKLNKKDYECVDKTVLEEIDSIRYLYYPS